MGDLSYLDFDGSTANIDPKKKEPSLLDESIGFGLDANTQDAADSLRLSKKHDMPQSEVANALPELRKQEKVDDIDIDDIKTNYPTIEKAFTTNPALAEIYAESMDTLKGLEKTAAQKEDSHFFTGMTKTLPAGMNKTFQGIKKFLATDLKKGNEGGFGGFDAMQAYRDIKNPKEIDVDAENAKASDEKKFQDDKVEFLTNAIANAEQSIVDTDKVIQENTPKLSPTMQGVRGGIESFITQIPLIAASALTKSAAPMTLGMGSQSFGQSYADGTTKGLEHEEATVYASINAASEIITEYGPAKIMTGMLKNLGQKGFTSKAKKWMATEALGEQINTVVNSVNDYSRDLDQKWLKAETWQEKAAIQLEKQYVTLVSTAVQGGAQTSIIGGINKLLTPQEQADNIEGEILDKTMQGSSEQDQLDQVTGLMQSMMEQSPEGAQEYYQVLKEQYPEMPTSVYIEARDLQEAMADIEGPAAQAFYSDMLNNIPLNEDVQIPMEEYVSLFAENSTVRDNVRLSADGMSILDIKNAEPAMNAITAKIVEEAQLNEEAHTKSVEMFDSIKDQLYENTSLNSREAKLSASLMPSLMQRHAVERGISIEEAYETIPGVSINNEETVEGPSLESSIPNDLDIELESLDIDTGKVVKEKFNAKQIVEENNVKMTQYEALRKCL